MEDDISAVKPNRVLNDAAKALDDLTIALIQTPPSYEAFIRLSPRQQVGLVEWINSAANTRNQERRIRTICAVLARMESDSVSIGDTIWLDGQRILETD
jgi:hypothetical protein